MKVMHLITSLGRGGTQSMLYYAVPRLEGEHFAVALKDDGEVASLLREKGIKVYCLDFNGLNLPSSALKFRRIIKAERPDIINSYLIHANLFGRFFGRLFGVKKIICSIRSKHLKAKPLLNFIDRMTSFMVTAYVPNSRVVADALVSVNGIDPDKIVTIENGLEVEKFHLAVDKEKIRCELCLEGRFVIGCVGRLMKSKGHEYLLKTAADVVKKHPECMFLIIGDGEEKERINTLIDALGIKKYVWMMGTRGDVPALLNIMDIFALPTLFEGMSNAILEAMAAECAVVTTDIPENTELARHNEEALLVKTEDTASLAEAITLLIENEPMRKKLAAAAYNRAREMFSIDITVKKYTELYEKHR